MKIMKNMKMKSLSYTAILICLVLCIALVNANVLFGPSIDKEVLTKNEVAFLDVTIYNDNNFEVKDFLRLEASDNIAFLESDDLIFLQEFGPIKPYEKEVLRVKIKAKNTKTNEGRVYGYYGLNSNGDAQYAFVARVQIEERPIFIESKTQKIITSTGETITTTVKMINYKKEPLYNVAFEMKAPNAFEIKTAPLFFEQVDPEETVTGTFEIQPPIETLGKQKVILAYGYFDTNGPHYFEESFDLDFSQGDSRLLLGVVGIIVLIVAIFLYMSSKKENKKIKGTKEKSEDEK